MVIFRLFEELTEAIRGLGSKFILDYLFAYVWKADLDKNLKIVKRAHTSHKKGLIVDEKHLNKGQENQTKGRLKRWQL